MERSIGLESHANPCTRCSRLHSSRVLTRDAVLARSRSSIELATELSRAPAPRHAQLISREILGSAHLHVRLDQRWIRRSYLRPSPRIATWDAWTGTRGKEKSEKYYHESANVNVRWIFNLRSPLWKRFLRRWKNIVRVWNIDDNVISFKLANMNIHMIFDEVSFTPEKIRKNIIDVCSFRISVTV